MKQNDSIYKKYVNNYSDTFNDGFLVGSREEQKRILKIIDKWINNNSKINVDINKIENEVLKDLRQEIEKTEVKDDN
jgi:hypothetical protein